MSALSDHRADSVVSWLRTTGTHFLRLADDLAAVKVLAGSIPQAVVDVEEIKRAMQGQAMRLSTIARLTGCPPDAARKAMTEAGCFRCNGRGWWSLQQENVS